MAEPDLALTALYSASRSFFLAGLSASTKSFASVVFRVANKPTTRDTGDANDFVHGNRLTRKKPLSCLKFRLTAALVVLLSSLQAFYSNQIAELWEAVCLAPDIYYQRSPNKVAEKKKVQQYLYLAPKSF